MLKKVNNGHVLSAWTGIRPLVMDIKNDENTSNITRNHVIENKGNFITITGGKWTTYRVMAEDVIKEVIKNLQQNENTKELLETKKLDNTTKDCKLYGAEQWTPYFYVYLIEKYKIDEKVYLIKK